MPQNQNPWVAELLSWHSHDIGSVKVPFRSGLGNPLGMTISTELTRRLANLADQIASGQSEVRSVFLVGGPGNGKSQDVQHFLETLDANCRFQGRLIAAAGEAFGAPGFPRKVEIDLTPLGHRRNDVERIIVVQDASESEQAFGNAAAELVEDMERFLDHPNKSLFVCCANRGLLARAVRAAESSGWDRVAALLENIIRGTTLAQSSTHLNRIPCWPMQGGKVACWPLDLQSLLDDTGSGITPFIHIVAHATAAQRWAICGDCSNAGVCPFFANAQHFQTADTLENLRDLLRMGELASGKRLNFREVFSLVAELMVGDWSDFAGSLHPCHWVNQQKDLCEDWFHPKNAAPAALALSKRLYYQSLYPFSRALAIPQDRGKWRKDSISAVLAGAATRHYREPSSPIRQLLARSLAPEIDPGLESPDRSDLTLRRLEDACSHPLEYLLEETQEELHPVELRLLQVIIAAEHEARTQLRKDTRTFSEISKFLRIFLSEALKRKYGTLEGCHANETYLKGYLTIISANPPANEVNLITSAVRKLVGRRFSLLSTFGQATAHGASVVTLVSSSWGPSRLVPATQASELAPAIELPFLQIGKSHLLPLTFDLYKALRLTAEGCLENSLPTAVRAALDRIRQISAGELCRDHDKFMDGDAFIELGSFGQITVDQLSRKPRFDHAQRRN